MRDLPEPTGRQLTNVLRMHVELGRILNERKSRYLRDGIYEFKTTDGARLLYFFSPDGKTILTHGFKKAKEKVTNTEIDRAVDLKERWSEQSC
ncbi:MAG: type II toxin-antitoxin system RelE/ParE family toxin [Dehalococcoidia bacterium]|nr:type II toxin-antitoxin system RelE/ParE family toxin [Dehalococcoidia bacterium]